MWKLLLLAGCLFVGARAGSAPAWLLQTARNNPDLEREAGFGKPLSPGQVARLASQLYNGKPPQLQQEADWFQCVEPTRELFENFSRLYGRTFEGSDDKFERLNLFGNSLRRTILLNRIIQNEITNQTNYELKHEIRNYHFISPLGKQSVALWYADITDCELGLIKKTVFDIFYLIDQNNLAAAYKMALENSDYFPLLNEDGFEQMANILLVKLFDRFKGDEKMNQLFQWPIYLKKLASYAYNRNQLAQPDFKAKLALVTFAYPSYFKDLKYNWPAINRTSDNLRAHFEHEKFNRKHNRKFASRLERNKRLAIFRQRFSYLEALNEDANKWKNISFQPEWLRVYQADGTMGTQQVLADKLLAEDSELGFINNWNADSNVLRPTQYSDLTDEEFVAFLTNDFSLIDNNKESAAFLDSNFPIRALDDKARAELAIELESRRTVQLNEVAAPQKARETLTLARRVVDELISDVGLPVGSVMVADISEEEHFSVFNKLSNFFAKSYSKRAASNGPLTDSELVDERQRRYDQFKLNYGRFKAWFIKEGWQLNENQLLAMLRLADLSWQEIKLTLFKVCCLTEEVFSTLSASNATIQYLGSNDFLCQPIGGGGQAEATNEQERELRALELYYYYSVHFNKHHNDMDLFSKRFSTFRYNIDHVMRHSCVRGLTLYRSFVLKKPETLSNIDVLDLRRSYTDDINLDRYKYFVIPKVDTNPPSESAKLYTKDSFEFGSSAPTRASISYRRSTFFSSLLNKPAAAGSGSNNFQQISSYAEKLTSAAQNTNLFAQKYKQNSINRIYELVMQRYRNCALKYGNGADSNQRFSQQCQSSGPLADQASGSAQFNDNLLQASQTDPCAFYRLGLEPWAEGLTKQDSLSPRLITLAKC